ESRYAVDLFRYMRRLNYVDYVHLNNINGHTASKINNARKTQTGSWQFEVEWEGREMKNSWVDEKDMKDCPALFAEYEWRGLQ
ncbi:hypothetical protein PMAYCL1PPCAC_31389, partial [Pristionchus mayeri]